MRHRLILALGVIVVASGLTFAAAVTVVRGSKSETTSDQARSAPSPVDPRSAPSVPPVAGRDQLANTIKGLQAGLRRHSDNSRGWAQLGSAYVQQARITADPAYYPKAEQALQRSMTLKPEENFDAIVGLGALANAQHEFSKALDYGRRAEKLNGYNPAVYAVLNDAHTQLGEYPEASMAAQRMLELRPGVPSYARASYEFEQHGDNESARFALNKALDDASSPADIAFCRYYLGELSFNEGKPEDALRQYERGLGVDASYDPLLAGKAKAEAALGQISAARRDYRKVINRVPQPQYVIELGELEQSLGNDAAAREQYALLDVEVKLFAANGVRDDLTFAQFDADHGKPASALRHAEAEWKRRHSVLVADALAWALHVNGRDDEALVHAKFANKLGWRNATFLYHQGMIEAALGQRETGRAHLARALQLNPHFSRLQAPIARRTLAGLGGAP